MGKSSANGTFPQQNLVKWPEGPEGEQAPAGLSKLDGFSDPPVSLWLAEKSPTKWRFVAGKIIELYIYGEDLPWPRSLQEGNANGDGDLVEQSVPPFTFLLFSAVTECRNYSIQNQVRVSVEDCGSILASGEGILKWTSQLRAHWSQISG